MVPAVALPGCPAPLAPICATVGGAGSSVAGAGASAVLSALVGWVVTGAGWLLGEIGTVMSSSTRLDVTGLWFRTHYAAMTGIGVALALPMLLAGAIQAVYRQSPAVLVRSAFVHLPLAALLTGAAVQLVQLALATTDALCAAVSAGAGGQISRVLSSLAEIVVAQAGGGPGSAPLFVVVLGGLLVAGGALVLWLELLVRASAVYVAVLFLPLALASLVWPSVTHWCRRLVDTLVALVLSKFVMVAILSLGSGALASGSSSGFSVVLAGGALLLLAAFAPFALLRLVPAVEAGAVHQLEGARQRVRHAAAGPVPRSAALHALRGLQEAHRPALDPGEPGTVAADALELAGTAAMTGAAAATGSSGTGSSGTGGRRTGANGPTGATAGGAGQPGPGGGGGSSAGGALGGGGGGDGDGDGGGASGGTGGIGIPTVAGRPDSDAAFWDAVRRPRQPRRGTGGLLPGVTGAPLWRDLESPEPTPDPTQWDGGFADGGWDGSSPRPPGSGSESGSGVGEPDDAG